MQPTITEEKKLEPAPTNQNLSSPSEKTEQQAEEKTPSSFLDKFKKLKFTKPSFGKKDKSSEISTGGKGKFKQKD